MIGPPNLDESAFFTPKLRRCRFDLASLSWNQRLGSGADGYVWKVSFGERRPFALKVVCVLIITHPRARRARAADSCFSVQFYDTGLPELDAYYVAQRECQNSALLQMMAAAVVDANDNNPENPGPVLLNANPRTAADAIANIYAFSNQGRSECKQAAGAAKLEPIKALPRMRQCYGWMTVECWVFYGLPMSLRPPNELVVDKLHRSFPPEQTYTAIVYEYVEEGENDPAAVEAVTSLFWLAGFAYGHSPLAQNWKGGVAH